MSNLKSESISYQQFEVSTESDLYQSSDLKLIREREKINKNKNKKYLMVILILLFFFLFLILLILYFIKLYDYKNLETKVLDHIFFPYHSELISSLKILKKLKLWIKKITYEKTGIECKPSLRMYYKATKDGDIAFHEKTDKWEGYIILIKDGKNNIFGGYTSKNFQDSLILDIHNGLEKSDKTAFLFNLNKNEIYPVINDNEKHIYGDIDFGPVFGSNQYSDLEISKKFLSSKSYSDFPKIFNKKGIKNNNKNILRLTNGQKNFLIKELEVFRVNLLP